MRKQYLEAARCPKKIDIENEFVRFISSMCQEVDRKIQKGKQRLDLMNSKLDQRPLSKQAEAVATINDKISKLLREAEEAGTRGDVDQAQNLMGLCEKLKEDKDSLIKQYESCGFNFSEQKEMEVCNICAAFLVIGDAQSRIDDHLMGKQHIGYSRLRNALEEHKKKLEKLSEERRGGSSGSSSRRRDERSHHRLVSQVKLCEIM
jgi:septation ring formation regulator EzrA